MDKVTLAKEAIKTGLALVIVYGLSFASGWMVGTSAGIAVAMISLPTAGQSIYKGVLRLAGTIPGCLAGLAILALAPQERWLFVLLASGWIFLTTYMMASGKYSYFWNVAGFTCLIILVAGPASSQSAFQHAVLRASETAMGIIVYMLVTAFLWPRNNAGAIRSASVALLTTQSRLVGLLRTRLTGAGAGAGTGDDFLKLRTQEVRELMAFGGALDAEGSESYEVHSARDLWARLQDLSTRFMQALDRCQTSLAELEKIGPKGVLPDLDPFFTEIDRRFAATKGMLDGSAPLQPEPQAFPLAVNRDALHALSHLERAAVAVTGAQLKSIEKLSLSMFECVRGLVGAGGQTVVPRRSRRTKGPMVPDRDHALGALAAATATAVGFATWIYVNPPGHAGMYEIAGALAMLLGSKPQVKMSMFFLPMALILPSGIALYVFVLPALSMFAELAMVYLIFAFVVCFFLKGIGRTFGLVALVEMVPIQNHQAYSFAAVANGYIFVLMAILLVFVVSYITSSARPEKAFVSRVRRFFRAAEFLVSRLDRAPTEWERWKTAYYRREIRTLPGKLAAWGSVIDPKKFPGNGPEQVQGLVTRLQALLYRIDELLEAGGVQHAESLVSGTRELLGKWLEGLDETFLRWADHPEAEPAGPLKARLDTIQATLEQGIDTALQAKGPRTLDEDTAREFYRLLGGFRGVSEAAVAYAGVAGGVDWGHWREERF